MKVPDYYLRLCTERDALYSRVIRLERFLDTPLEEHEDSALLHEQLELMRGYLDILNIRISKGFTYE